ncbi:hypothetical protein [Streptomyces mirabilis]|uniref:hypothetical protein n=1 Tax=Streptomyces mirabilis TaxID=68239 RepID=UPI00369CC4B4
MAATPHHFVMTVSTQPTDDTPSTLISREGVIDWPAGETRQDQFAKVLQLVNADLRADGHTSGFVTTFWSLDPNRH